MIVVYYKNILKTYLETLMFSITPELIKMFGLEKKIWINTVLIIEVTICYDVILYVGRLVRPAESGRTWRDSNS